MGSHVRARARARLCMHVYTCVFLPSNNSFFLIYQSSMRTELNYMLAHDDSSMIQHRRNSPLNSSASLTSHSLRNRRQHQFPASTGVHYIARNKEEHRVRQKEGPKKRALSVPFPRRAALDLFKEPLSGARCIFYGPWMRSFYAPKTSIRPSLRYSGS